MNWIKVSDKLPELEPVEGTNDSMSATVLVWAIDEDGVGAADTGSYSTKWEGWLSCLEGTLEENGFRVTHWMPLPEPPEK